MAVPLLVLVVVLVLDPPTTLVLLFTGPILVLLLGFIGGRARAITERRFAEVRWLSAFFLDMLAGIATLKMFGRSAEQVDNIATISRQYGDTTMEVLRTAFQTSLVLEWGGAVAVALVAVEISLRLMAGVDRVRARAGGPDHRPRVLPAAPRAGDALPRRGGRAGGRRAGVRDPRRAGRRRPAAVGARSTGPRAGPAPGAAIRFDGVTVTYPGRTDAGPPRAGPRDPGRAAWSRWSGATGAGKSTVASLLLRFIEPDAGEILVGDVPLAAIDLAAWRAHVAWVPQRPHLFHGTVADNIRLARPDATTTRSCAAARDAGATRSSRRCRAATTRRSARAASGSAAASASGSRSPGRSWPMRGWSSSTRRPRTSTRRARRASATPSAGSRATGRCSSSRTGCGWSTIADVVVVLDRGRVVETGTPAELAGRDGPYRRLLDAAADGDDA